MQGTTVVTAAVVEVHSCAAQVKTTLNMSFRTDYLTMILYSPGPDQVSWGEKIFFTWWKLYSEYLLKYQLLMFYVHFVVSVPMRKTIDLFILIIK